MNRSDLRAWAVQEYGIDDSSISSSWTSDGAMDLGWSMPGWARYVARFELDGEGPLQQVEVYWSGVNLTAGRAAECLGSPQAYETYYPSQPPRSLVIKLWYADQTLALQSLGAAVPNPDGTVRVDGSLVMTGMTVGLPRPTGTVTSTQALLHAWPGDWPGTRPIDRMR